MKFQKTLNIANLSNEAISKLQIGQWVSNGTVVKREDRGQYLGTKKSGTIVVAWYGNSQGRFKQYTQSLLNYAKG